MVSTVSDSGREHIVAITIEVIVSFKTLVLLGIQILLLHRSAQDADSKILYDVGLTTSEN